MLDVREMLRRLRLGESARAVAKGLGVSRNTVSCFGVNASTLFPGHKSVVDYMREARIRLARPWLRTNR